jgi:hypothetical protein
MKNKEYPIDGDTADNITCIVLGEAVKTLKTDIKRLKKAIKDGEMNVYIYEDLSDNEKYLKALETSFQYFGGNLK